MLSNKNKIIILAISFVFFLSSTFLYILINSKNTTNPQKQVTAINQNSLAVKTASIDSNTSFSTQSKIPQSAETKENSSESKIVPKEIEVKIIETKPPSELQIAEIVPPKPVQVIPENKTQPISEPKIENQKYKIFQGNEWKDIYEKAKLSYPNIKSEYGGLNYFGDPALNQIVIDITLQRGFVKRNLVADESQLMYLEGYPIQKQMGEAITQVFKEMRNDGHPIIFLSGYRGIAEQSQVFGAEFSKQSYAIFGREVTDQEILDRMADNVINKTLETVALPGYSRHHQGYTVDVTESGTYYKDFEKTGSYEWMSKDNFANLKKYGIIPSYPKGVQEQGPEPESWEFVYVGKENLLN